MPTTRNADLKESSAAPDLGFAADLTEEMSWSTRASHAGSGALAGNSASAARVALQESSARVPKTTREGACAPLAINALEFSTHRQP